MRPYYAEDGIEIWNCDCREFLPTLKAEVDVVVTDPPYGDTSLDWDQPADVIPVSEAALERVRSGRPLRDVGRIDLRDLGDDLTFDAVAEARHEHRLAYRHGHKAPIRLREKQVSARRDAELEFYGEYCP